jgi:hypothetical protein
MCVVSVLRTDGEPGYVLVVEIVKELLETVFSTRSVPRCYTRVEFRSSSIPSRQRGCYIRTITARVQLKNSLVVSLKGLDAKTN